MIDTKRTATFSKVRTPKIRLSVSADKDLHEQILVESEAESCTVSDWVADALRSFMKRGAHTVEKPPQDTTAGSI